MLGWRTSLGATGVGTISVTSSRPRVGMAVGWVLLVPSMAVSAGGPAVILSVEAMVFVVGSIIVHSFPNELYM
jgi:hypothetical protein